MTRTWDAAAPGVVGLPSGRLVRGRALHGPWPDGPAPDLGIHLLRRPPAPVAWDTRWVRWPDFRLPTDRALFDAVLRESLDRAAGERVEFVCSGGRGRTGTALACLAVLDGVPAGGAVAWVRSHYSPRAMETPGQRRFVRRYAPPT